MSEVTHEGGSIFGDKVFADNVSGDKVFGSKIYGDYIQVDRGVGKMVNKNNGDVTGFSNAKHSEPQEPESLQVTLENLSHAVMSLRAELAERDRAALDESLSQIRDRGNEPGVARHAFYAIAGIATVVSSVGAPIVEAIRQVLDAING